MHRYSFQAINFLNRVYTRKLIAR